MADMTETERAPAGKNALLAVVHFVRDTILIIGTAVLLFIVVEGCVRLWEVARDSMRGREAAGPPSPNAGKPWVAQFNREFDATRNVGWQSYVYFRRFPNYHGKYVNIDSAGHRVTPQPNTPATPVAKVFFLGGSTMWGSFQRDSGTIAAVASRRLQELAGPGNRIDVTNLGEQGWVNSQEMLELMLQLRAGQRPDVVVFVDGINEPFATLQAGRAGIPQNEAKRVTDFNMGRKLDRTLFGRGFKNDVKAIGTLTLAMLQHTETFAALASRLHRDAPAEITPDSAANATIHVYAENVKLVQALAAAYHFTPIFVWQPTLQSTDKKLTPFEQSLLRPGGKELKDPLSETYRLLPPRLDSLMATVDAAHFVDATHVFKDSPLPVFMDRIGHNSEESIPLIVDSFWPKLSAAVQASLQQTKGGARK